MRTPFVDIHGRVGLVLYTKPDNCGGECLYCFSQAELPPSLYENEDTLRAKSCNWDPTCQLEKLFSLYDLDKGTGNKCEIIVLGGSFTNYSKSYLLKFVKAIYDFFNGFVSKNLEEAKKMQLNAPDRCVAFCVETRPDLIDEDWCKFLLNLGITKVELGVQSLNNSVLEINQRGYTEQTIIKATHLLRNFGFKIGYHIMPGMVGSNWEIDVETLGTKLWEKDLCPDYLKIYPCVFLKGNYKQNGLSKKLNSGFKLLSNKMYEKMLLQIKSKIPKYVMVQRIQRIIPPAMIAKGPSKIFDRNKYNKICNCIWHRQVGRKNINSEHDFSDFRINTYKQGNGFYVEAVLSGTEIILGYGRVSFDLEGKKARIRELRVFGNMLRVSKKNDSYGGVLPTQHRGIGKMLIHQIEELSLKNNCVNLFLNAGVGVRGYFISIGYKVQGNYLFKKL